MKKRSLEEFLVVFKNLTIANIQYLKHINMLNYISFDDTKDYENEIIQVTNIINSFKLDVNHYFEYRKIHEELYHSILSLINLNLEILKGNIDLVFDVNSPNKYRKELKEIQDFINGLSFDTEENTEEKIDEKPGAENILSHLIDDKLYIHHPRNDIQKGREWKSDFKGWMKDKGYTDLDNEINFMEFLCGTLQSYELPNKEEIENQTIYLLKLFDLSTIIDHFNNDVFRYSELDRNEMIGIPENDFALVAAYLVRHYEVFGELLDIDVELSTEYKKQTCRRLLSTAEKFEEIKKNRLRNNC